MRTTSFIVSCAILVAGCSDPGPGSSSSEGTGNGGSPGVTSGSGSTGGSGGAGAGGDPSGTGGAGTGGDPSGTGGGGTGGGGTGGAGTGGDPSGTGGGGTGGAGAGGDPSGSGGGGTGGDPSGSGGAGAGGSGGAGAGGSGGAGGGGGTGGGPAPIFPCGTPDSFLDAPEAFLDLGHVTAIGHIFVSGDRVLSWDHNRWILWDTATRVQIAEGLAPAEFSEPSFPGQDPVLQGRVELRGDLMLIPTDPRHGFELRSAADGSLLATVSTDHYHDKVGLAADGSYAWTVGTRLTVWSPTGDEVLSTDASGYEQIHAGPDAVRVATSGSVNSSIRVLPLDGSPPHSTPAFAGTFHSWSQDGQRFLTTAGNTVRVYSKAGAMEAIVHLPSIEKLTAAGDYLWTHQDRYPDYPVTIYRIGGGNVPVAQYAYASNAVIVPTERAIGVMHDTPPTLEIIDLGGPEVTRTQHEIPGRSNSAMHIDGGLRWAVGNVGGAITQKGNLADPDTIGRLGCGAARLGGAASGLVAVATSSGTTFIYDTADLGAGPAMSIPLHSSRVRLSADGRLLVALAIDTRHPYPDDRFLRILSLPDGAEVASLATGASLFDFSLSSSGTTLGRTYLRNVSPSTNDRFVSDVSGATVFYQDTGPSQPVPVISPGGHHFLLTDETPENGCGFTQFYEDGMLVNAVPGCAVGWIDDTRALIQTYTRASSTAPWQYQASIIHDELGNPIATPPLPRISLTRKNSSPFEYDQTYGIVPVSPTAVHAGFEHAIYDIETGATLATLPARGTLAGSLVVYPCGNELCAAPY
ncbi:hypothetical protein [Sorangium sp. So ce1335]|uniref:hypothetical protein n=1 Tax=Sorangium sp. So ce1335 TaxID=3133335 RepID=UPI003F63DB7A